MPIQSVIRDQVRRFETPRRSGNDILHTELLLLLSDVQHHKNYAIFYVLRDDDVFTRFSMGSDPFIINATVSFLCYSTGRMILIVWKLH